MKSKRWIGVLLCMLLCVGMLPTMAFAADQMTVSLNGQELISGQEVQCGEGTIEFDSANNILTLDNATISESSTESVLRIQGQGGVLTIKLLGNNKISSTSENYFPIAISNADVTIQGTNADTLTLESNSDSLNGSHCNLTIDGCTVNVTSHNWGGIVTGGGVLSIKNKAAVTINSYDPAIWSENGIQIADSSVFATANGDGVNTVTSYGDISISNSEVEVKGTSSAAYPALYAAGNININNRTTLTAESNGMRGIFTDSSMMVDDSTVTASGATDEGIIAVDTFSIDNSKVTASSKPDDVIPAIVTYNLNITASDVTAKGGIQLWDFNSGETTGRTFSITPAEGKLAEFKVDGTNWDGSGASHFKEGAKSPYDAAVTFTESEMNWLDAYRYVHIGEHIHSGGTATCTENAICTDCGKTYGDLNPNNHSGEVVRTKTATDHSSTYDCCGATVVAEEAHEWENGVCSECGYECQHNGGTATCADKAVCDTCGEEYGEVNTSNHTNLVKTEAKAATHMTEGNIEYWYCDGCDKYFSDEAGTKEIALADTVIPKLTEHTADSTGWYSDETNHWNTCECGEKLNEAAHTFEWVIDKEATATEKGSKHEKCTVCGYEKAAVEIPATGTPSDSDTSSPQTGDDSNIALWIAVMLAAGVALTGTAVYSRKRMLMCHKVTQKATDSRHNSVKIDT